jgi:hypothetical protein
MIVIYNTAFKMLVIYNTQRTEPAYYQPVYSHFYSHFYIETIPSMYVTRSLLGTRHKSVLWNSWIHLNSMKRVLENEPLSNECISSAGHGFYTRRKRNSSIKK